MFDIVADLSNLTIPQLIARLRAIRAGIAAQAVFSSLAAQLTALDGLIDALEALELALTNAKNAVKPARLARDSAEDALLDAVKPILSDVAKLATDPAQIIAAHLRIRGETGPRPIPDQPTGLELTVGDEEGELSGQCNGQPGIVDRYDVEYTTTDPNAPGTTWIRLDSVEKSRFDLNGLPSGQKVWVHIRAVNKSGHSPWSDPACKRVP